MSWYERARAAGLRQATIAAILGYTADGVSRGLRRDPVSEPIRAIVAAWEVMTPEQRIAWRAALGNVA